MSVKERIIEFIKKICTDLVHVKVFLSGQIRPR